MTTDAIAILRSLGACDTSWVTAQHDTSPLALWTSCPRADWLAWYTGRSAIREHPSDSPMHRKAALIAAICAERALDATAGADRGPSDDVRRAVAGTKAWGGGASTAPRARSGIFTEDVYLLSAQAATAVAAARLALASTVDPLAACECAARSATCLASLDMASMKFQSSAEYTAAYESARKAKLLDLAHLIRLAIPSPPMLKETP